MYCFIKNVLVCNICCSVLYVRLFSAYGKAFGSW